MGGSILFTQSATFSPSLYGLTTGKFINYIIIGGGGAGAGVESYIYSTTSSDNYYNSYGVLTNGGTNGGTSSIGSYVSAAGGVTATNAQFSTSKTVAGGGGAGGWVPGKIFQSYQSGNSATISGTNSSLDSSGNFNTYYDGGQKIVVSLYGENAVTSYPTANIYANSLGIGTGSPNPYNLTQNAGTPLQGNDGIGYGAGGGGTSNNDAWDLGSSGKAGGGDGGNSGEFKQGSFKLTSTSDIAITIGAGGSPHVNVTQGDWDVYTHGVRYLGRIGTHGAVMLFWD